MADDWDQFPQATPVDVALHAEGVTGEPAKLVRALYQQESSSGKNTATSNAGAVGGMQVTPAAFKQVAEQDWDIKDPLDNARAGVRYAKLMHDKSGGDPVIAAAGYYGGPGGLEKAKQGIAVSDPRNPNAPNTIEYGQQVAQRMASDTTPAAAPPAAPEAVPTSWDAFPEVKKPAGQVDLPPGVKPSSAGAGRGSVNPAPAAAVAPRSTLQELGRQLGLTTRAAVSGVAAIPAMMSDAVTGPINAGLDAVAGKGNGFRFQPAEQALGNVMTAAGVPQPETATERVVQDVGSAMTGAGSVAAAGKALSGAAGPVASAVGDQVAAGAGMQIGSAATGSGASGIVRERGGSPAAQIAAGVAGSLAPGVIPLAAGAATRGLLRGGEEGRQQVADNIAAFQAAGTSPTLGQATEGRVARATESLLAKTPGGAGVIAARAQRQADDMAGAVQSLSDELAPGASAANAGEAIARGVTAFKDGFKTIQQKLYTDLDQHIPSGTPIQVGNTEFALKALNEDIPGAPSISEFFKNAKIKGIDRALQSDLEQAATGNTLPYEAVKKLRTLVGNEIADSNFASDVPRSKWSALYGALSQDLGVAANNAGPEATASWQWANTFTKQQLDRLDQLSGIVSKDAPEKIFAAAVSGTGEGDTIVRRVVNALPKEERRQVAAAVLQRLGRATPGQQDASGNAFSSETFLTNLSKLSAAARKTLFGRTDVQGLEDRVAELGKVAELRRTAGKVFANPSGTAPAAAQMAVGGSLAGAAYSSMVTGNPLPLAAAASVPAAAYGIARVLTSPKAAELAATTAQPIKGTQAAAVEAATRAQGQPQPPAPTWDDFPAATAPGAAAAPVQAAPVIPASAPIALPAQPAASEPAAPAQPAAAPVPQPVVSPGPNPAKPDIISRIQQLRDAGESAAADHLQAQVDRDQTAHSIISELAGMQQAAPDLPIHGHPEFTSAYTAMRQDGMPPAEASARATMAGVVRATAPSVGLSPEAVAAVLDKAKTMPLADVPAFVVKFANNMAAKGAAKPIQDPQQLVAMIGNLRDQAMHAAITHAYPAPQATAQAPATDAGPQSVASPPVAEATAQGAPAAAPSQQAQEFAAQPRKDGTLLLRGDAQAIRDTLTAAGVPGASLMTMKSGVAVGATQAPKVQAAIDRMQQADGIDQAAHEAATSPHNDKPEPSERQIAAGNYSKGHVQLQGLDISIENPKGSTRRGVDPDGKPWGSTLASHYGYVLGTKGNDGEHVDAFIGPDPASKKVFVVDQVHPDGSFDEHKSMIGFNSREEAEKGYLANYSAGWQGLGAITELPMSAFKAWVASGHLKQPLGELREPADATA